MLQEYTALEKRLTRVDSWLEDAAANAGLLRNDLATTQSDVHAMMRELEDVHELLTAFKHSPELPVEVFYPDGRVAETFINPNTSLRELCALFPDFFLKLNGVFIEATAQPMYTLFRPRGQVLQLLQRPSRVFFDIRLSNMQYTVEIDVSLPLSSLPEQIQRHMKDRVDMSNVRILNLGVVVPPRDDVSIAEYINLSSPLLQLVRVTKVE
jgi:hypothetical protein